ncbi:MAG: hypothetical protein AAF943_15010 [Pseudomonadota bacterium]
MGKGWLWWAPLALLTLGIALLGLRWGWVAATITETDVITRYAQRYVNTHGGAAKPTDCFAMPADHYEGVWLVVRCVPLDPQQGPTYDYYVNRMGGYLFGEKPQGDVFAPPEI